MPLPCPKKVNTDFGCSPKPMSKPAQIGVIHVGQPWSTSQARNNSGSRTNLAGQKMGQLCSTPSQQQDQQWLVASFPSLRKGSSWLDWCKPSPWCKTQLLELHWWHGKLHWWHGKWHLQNQMYDTLWMSLLSLQSTCCVCLQAPHMVWWICFLACFTAAQMGIIKISWNVLVQRQYFMTLNYCHWDQSCL